MRQANETVTSVTYSGGTRTEAVERTVTKADDAEQVGNHYFRLAGVYRQLETCQNDTERAALEADKEKILSEIATYTGYLEGYEI